MADNGRDDSGDGGDAVVVIVLVYMCVGTILSHTVIQRLNSSNISSLLLKVFYTDPATKGRECGGLCRR